MPRAARKKFKRNITEQREPTPVFVVQRTVPCTIINKEIIMKENYVLTILNLCMIVFTVLQILIDKKITSILLIVSVLVFSFYLFWLLFKNGKKILSVLVLILGVLIAGSDVVVLNFSSIDRHQFALIMQLVGYILLNVMNFFMEDKQKSQ